MPDMLVALVEAKLDNVVIFVVKVYVFVFWTWKLLQEILENGVFFLALLLSGSGVYTSVLDGRLMQY